MNLEEDSVVLQLAESEEGSLAESEEDSVVLPLGESEVDSVSPFAVVC